MAGIFGIVGNTGGVSAPPKAPEKVKENDPASRDLAGNILASVDTTTSTSGLKDTISDYDAVAKKKTKEDELSPLATSLFGGV